MAVAAKEPLYDSSVGNNQGTDVATSYASTGNRTVTSKLDSRQRPSISIFLKMTFKEQATAFVAVASIFLSLAAMIAEWSTSAVIAGILQIIMGSYAFYQQTQITTMVISKQKIMKLEKDVVRLKGENTRMSYVVDELDGRVEDLLDVEDALEMIAASENQSVEELEKDAYLNRQIAAKIEHCAETSAIETLISSIYSRQDSEIAFSEEEVATMIQKFRAIKGLTVNEDRLRDAVLSKKTESIIDMLQNLVDEDIPLKKQIFRFY